MDAEEWARWIPHGRFNRSWEDLDRNALRSVPDYLTLTERLGSDLFHEAQEVDRQRRQHLLTADPTMHDALQVSGWRLALRLVSVFTSGGTIAFYFTRSAIDRDFAMSGAAALLTASALFLWAAALPIHRRTPPAFWTALVSWTAAAAGVVAIGVPALGRSRRPELLDTPTYVVTMCAAVGCLVLAIIQSIRRARLPVAVKSAMERAPEREKAYFEPLLEQMLDHRVRDLESAYAALPAERRLEVEHDLAAAAAVLAERGLVRSAATVADRLPGLAIIDLAGAAAASVLGVPQRPLVPGLRPGDISS